MESKKRITLFLVLRMFFMNLFAAMPHDLSLLRAHLMVLALSCSFTTIQSAAQTAPIKHELNLLAAHLLRLNLNLGARSPQQFIDFNTGEFQQLILSPTPYLTLTTTSPQPWNANAELVQLVVAWQDLPFGQFFEHPFSIAHLQELQKRFKGTSPMIDLLQNQGYSLQATVDLINLLQNKNDNLLRDSANFKEVHKEDIDELIGGGEASCGYHTIKNSLLACNAIYSATPTAMLKNINDMLEIANFVVKLFGLPKQNWLVNGKSEPGLWRHWMIAFPVSKVGSAQIDNYDNTNKKDAEWLHSTGLLKLWNDSFAIQATTQIGAEKELLREVYAQQHRLSPPIVAGGGYVPTDEIIKKFTEPTALEIFFVNAKASGEPLKEKERGNHWFALVVNKVNGRTQGIILDSKNAPRYKDPTVIRIMTALADTPAIPSEPTPEAAQTAIKEFITAQFGLLVTGLPETDIVQQLTYLRQELEKKLPKE